MKGGFGPKRRRLRAKVMQPAVRVGAEGLMLILHFRAQGEGQNKITPFQF